MDFQLQEKKVKDTLTDQLTFLMDLFNPVKFSSERGLKMLQDIGGLSCLLNRLNVSHREGLPHFTDHAPRIAIYGQNSAPAGQSLLRKSLSEERDFMVNLLLYVLTLKVCIKLLLYRESFIYPHSQFDQQLVASVGKEVISFILLLGMIYLKAMVNVRYFDLDTDERKYKYGKVRVRRDGEQFDIDESQLLVGDIIIMDKHNTIRVDGVLLDSRRLLVSEEQTILRSDASYKQAVWGEQGQRINGDPFILAGSKVVSGTGELLVCTVGQLCSFRRTKQYSSLLEQTPVIREVKRYLTYVENLGKIGGITLTIVIVYWFLSSDWHLHDEANVQGGDSIGHKILHAGPQKLNHILKIIASFIGMTCMLQRLKVVRSLKFFIEGSLSGTHYRIKNKEAIEKLSQMDIIFLEEAIISKNIRKVRQEEVTQIPNIGVLSAINNYYHLKIITPEKQDFCISNYGTDIAKDQIYAKKREHTALVNLENLKNATFITECSTDRFITKLLPIYQSMNYKIAYVSNAQNLNNSTFPNRFLHLTFQKVGARTDRCIDNEWVRFQNRVMVEQVLQELIYKSFAFAKLYNSYMSLTINNIAIFFSLSWYSLREGVAFDLAWTLALIIINRYTFFNIYGRIAIESSYNRFAERSKWEAIKFNLFLVPYFLYVISHLQSQANIFLFLLANSLFRVQSLLFSIDRKRSLTNWNKLLILSVLLNIGNILLSETEERRQEMRNMAYTLGLAMLYSGFIVIA